MTRRTHVWLVVAILVVAWQLVAPPSVMAQTTSTGVIAGTARDTSGAVMPGVTVEAASAQVDTRAATLNQTVDQKRVVELPPQRFTGRWTSDATESLAPFIPYT